MTNNAINTTNNGQTGTGEYASSDSPSITGDVDLSSVSLEAPNSASPTLSSVGQIAIDTDVTDFQQRIQYHDGSTQFTTIPIKESDLSTVDGDILGYESTSKSFKLAPQGYSSVFLQRQIGFSDPVGFFTNSTTPVATSLDVSITPGAIGNRIVIQSFGTMASLNISGLNNSQHYATVYLYRIAPVTTSLGSFNIGRDSETSTQVMRSDSPIYLISEETAASTALHTYQIRISVPNVNVTALFGSNPVMSIIAEEFSP